MTKKQLLISILICLIIIPSYGKEVPPEPVVIGLIEEETKVLIAGGESYNLYKLQGSTYIPISYLEKMGVLIEKKNNGFFIYYPSTFIMDKAIPLSLKDEPAALSQASIYIGNLRTYSLQVGEHVLIPLEALNLLWDIKVYQGAYVAEPYWSQMNSLVAIDDTMIKNVSEHVLKLQCLHLWWDGKNFIEEIENDIILEQGASRDKILTKLERKGTYLTTVILCINDFETKVQRDNLYGQKNQVIFKRYEEEKRRRYLSKLFPIYKIMGTMKYTVGDFKEKDQVEIWRSEKRLYYVIKDEKGKKTQVPWSSVTIEGDRGVLGTKALAEDIEDFVRLNEVESETEYLLWTDVYRQRTYVLKKLEDKWHLEKNFICSTGRNSNPTPSGFFVIEYLIPYIGLDKGYRCKTTSVFFKDYMYHSILFDRTGKYIKSGQYDLGRRVSHGCVRLGEQDSAWIYKNIPLKTKVWIR